jgi:hypothetical protein
VGSLGGVVGGVSDGWELDSGSTGAGFVSAAIASEDFLFTEESFVPASVGFS